MKRMSAVDEQAASSLRTGTAVRHSSPVSSSEPLRSDAELWGDVLRGNNAAWRQLVERHSRLVYSVCQYIGLSYADSADCFQQTWLLLFRNRRKIKDVSRLTSWLVTTSRREAIRLRRRRMNASDDPELLQLAGGRRPDEDFNLLELQHHLELALAGISDDCRHLLQAFFFADEESSYREVANRMGYSINTLGAKRRRCLEKLKEELVRNGYIDERNSDD